MANFDSGVASYVHTQAVVEVSFPVDFRGVADISCNQCPFLRRQSRSCALNNAVVAYPEKYVGNECPLIPVDE